VRRIIRLLGYRPRPGIGATGVVAARTDSARPFTLGRGLGIEGVAGPGQPAQVFELDDDVEIGALGRPLSTSFLSIAFQKGTSPAPKDEKGRFLNSIPAKPSAETKPVITVEEGKSFKVTLDGVVTLVKPGNLILILKRDWGGALLDRNGYALAEVREVSPAWDATGHAVTELTALSAHGLPAGAERGQYRILHATKLAHLWQTEPDIDLRDLADVSVPTLVLAGDDDIVTPEHAVAIAAVIPDAQLAIIPGASHASPLEKPALVNQILLDFLADEQSPKFFTPDAVS